MATVPIYNVVPDQGYPAQFEFEIDGAVLTLHASVNAETNYGVRVVDTGIPQVSGVFGSYVTFFGTPPYGPEYQ